MPVLSGLAYNVIAFDVPNGDNGQAKAVNTGLMSWTAASSYILDPTQNNQLLEMQNIQSVFIDNYNTGTLIVSVNGTGHIIRIPPKSQAFMPLLCSDRPIITFSNSGANGSSQAWLMNIPALGVVWAIP